MNQAPVAVRLAKPEPAYAAMVPLLAPKLGVKSSIGAEGSVDLLAVVDAPFGEVRAACDGQGDVGQHEDLHLVELACLRGQATTWTGRPVRSNASMFAAVVSAMAVIASTVKNP